MVYTGDFSAKNPTDYYKTRFIKKYLATNDGRASKGTTKVEGISFDYADFAYQELRDNKKKLLFKDCRGGEAVAVRQCSAKARNPEKPDPKGNALIVKAGYLGSDRLRRAKVVRRLLSESPSSYAAKGTSSVSILPSRQRQESVHPYFKRRRRNLPGIP